MNGFQKVAVIIAGTGMLTAAVLPGRKTAEVIKAFFGGVTSWTKQQADLTDEERQLLAEYKASKQSGGTPEKPSVAETARPGAAAPAKVKAETTENKKP